MKKIYTTIAFALMAMTSMAQEANDTTYVTLDFNQNPWNYPVREVTEGWRPDTKDWDSPGAILDNTDFSWPVSEGSSEKIKATLYAVDLDEYANVSVYGHVEINAAEASSFGTTADHINVLYTQPGTTMRFEAPEHYKFGKMVFYCFHSPNFLVGDEYDEEFEYEYESSTFKQKLKVWKPTSSKQNAYGYDIWQGDDTNILFNYPYFNAHFVKVDIRLVSDGTSAIQETANSTSQNSTYYDLQGRKVKTAQKGIYVTNGKKVIR